MNGLSKFCRILLYIWMAWCTFVTLGSGIIMTTGKFAAFGWGVLIVTLAAFVGSIVLDILKLRWSSFFTLTAGVLVHLYLVFSLTNRSGGLERIVFYKNHLPFLILAVLSLGMVLCYKKYRKDNEICFEKTKKDQEKLAEKEAAEADFYAELIDGDEAEADALTDSTDGDEALV